MYLIFTNKISNSSLVCGGKVARRIKAQAGPAIDKIRVEVPGIKIKLLSATTYGAGTELNGL